MPRCLRARSVLGDGEPHSPELADELAVGRMQAGAELCAVAAANPSAREVSSLATRRAIASSGGWIRRPEAAEGAPGSAAPREVEKRSIGSIPPVVTAACLSSCRRSNLAEVLIHTAKCAHASGVDRT